MWQSNKVASHKFGSLWLSSGIQLEQYDDDLASGLNIQESTPVSAICYNKLAMSIEDESVLQYYNDTVKLVKMNDKSNLDFSLPWAHDPGTIENNFTQAKDALLGLRRKIYQ